MEEKSGKGEHRPQKSVQEILRGSQYDQKYRFFKVLASLGAVRGGDGKRLAEPIGVAVIDPKDGKLIYKLTPLRPLLDIAAIWGPRFVLLGCSGTSLLSVLPR